MEFTDYLWIASPLILVAALFGYFMWRKPGEDTSLMKGMESGGPSAPAHKPSSTYESGGGGEG